MALQKTSAPQHILYSIPFSIFEICHVILFQISLTRSTNHASGPRGERGNTRGMRLHGDDRRWLGISTELFCRDTYWEKKGKPYGRFLSSIIGKSRITEGSSDAVGDALRSPRLKKFIEDTACICLGVTDSKHATMHAIGHRASGIRHQARDCTCMYNF